MTNTTYLTILLCLLSVSLLAQQRYLPGYLITDEGQRRNVLLRTGTTTTTTPERITFRDATDAPVQHLPVGEVRGFGTDDGSERYIRYTVRVDTSRQQLSELTTAKRPEWKTLTDVLLRQLVAGAADLFYWSDGKREAYFLRTGDGVPQALIARRYRGKGRTVHQDNSYIAQLAALPPCTTSAIPPQPT